MASLDVSQMITLVVVICLILWRMSYGKNNGLFAEAAGLIAVIAAYIAVHYSIIVVKNVIHVNLGNVIPKIGHLAVALLVYKIMTALADAFRRIKDIPIVGAADRLLGAVLGAVEAVLIILLVEYVTDIEIIKTVLTAGYEILHLIQKSFINK